MADVPISAPRVVVTRPKSAAINVGSPHAPSSPSRPGRPSTGSASGRLLTARRDSRESSTSGACLAEDSQPPYPPLTADTTGNVYHAMVARKQAEEKAAQLARRMAFYREQEERVLCEVKAAKSQLERCLMAPLRPRAQSAGYTRSTLWSSLLVGDKSQHSRACSPTKSREQRQFLMVGEASIGDHYSSTDALSCRSSDGFSRCEGTRSRDRTRRSGRFVCMRKPWKAASPHLGTLQTALEAQRARDLVKDQTKHLQMERIRRQQQQALEQRAAQQVQSLSYTRGQCCRMTTLLCSASCW